MIVTFYYADGSKKILRPSIKAGSKSIGLRPLMEQLRHDFGAESFKIRL